MALMATQDRTAFDQLRARHGKSLYALAYQVLMDREAADWVVRDVFDYAWKRAGLWTLALGRRSVGEWLSGLTRASARALAQTESAPGARHVS